MFEVKVEVEVEVIVLSFIRIKRIMKIQVLNQFYYEGARMERSLIIISYS